MSKKTYKLNDLEIELMQDPAFVQEYQANKPYSEVALKIIKLRTEAGITQAELAKRIGTQQSAVSRLENFEYKGISLKKLNEIAEALGKKLEVNFI
jgi:DNA-binding Xre family transcriptional regulator